MARSKESEVLAYWQSQYRKGLEWRNQGKRTTTWRRLVSMYRGHQWNVESENHRAIVNMSKSTVDTILPSVAVNDPSFEIEGVAVEYDDQAAYAQELINFAWTRFDFTPEFQRVLLDALIIGHGWGRTGYVKPRRYDHGVIDVEGREVTDDRPDLVDVAEGGEAESIDMLGADRVESATVQDLPLAATSWDEEFPTLNRISPLDVVVNPNAVHPSTMRWVAQRSWRPVADVRADKRYAKSVRRAVTGKTSQEVDEEGSLAPSDDQGDDGQPYVEVIELWDYHSRQEMVFLADQTATSAKREKFLIPPRPFTHSFGAPLKMLRGYEVPDQFYPLGELEPIEQLQQELNLTRTQMMSARAAMGRKYLYATSVFSSEEAENALRSTEDNVFVPFDGNIHEMGGAVLPFPHIPQQSDMYAMSEVILQDMDRVSGVSEFMRGQESQIRRTATEMAMMQDAQTSKAAWKLSTVTRYLSALAEMLIKTMQVSMEGSMPIRLGSVRGAAWSRVERDMIEGQFMFTVKAGSTQPTNEAYRKQEATQFVEGSQMLIQLGVLNPMKIAEYWLNAHGITDISEFVVDPTPPEQATEGPEAAAGMVGPPSTAGMTEDEMMSMLMGGGNGNLGVPTMEDQFIEENAPPPSEAALLGI